MSGVFMRFARGRNGTSGAHARYITRPTATGRDPQALLTRHYPDDVRDAGDYGELRDQLEEYCRQQEDGELSRPFRGGHGETRTHYRMVLSFEEHIATREARDLAEDYLERTFPTTRALAAVHQDTAHTHVHVHLQARDIDDRKLHFDRHSYERLDDAWAEVYARAYGQEKLIEHEQKKEETRAWKRESARAQQEGRDAPPRPEREDHHPGRAEGRAHEERTYGLDQTRDRGDQRAAPDPDPVLAGGGRTIDDVVGERDRAVQAVARAEREAGETVRTAESLAERVRGGNRGHDYARSRTRDDDDERGR